MNEILNDVSPETGRMFERKRRDSCYESSCVANNFPEVSSIDSKQF